jgi:hypothetical protein
MSAAAWYPIEDGPGDLAAYTEGDYKPPVMFEQTKQGIRVLFDSDEPPQWAVDAALRASTLVELPREWDGFDADPISEIAVITALRFLAYVWAEPLPLPDIIPVPHGGVQLEWHVSGIDLEVEFGENNPVMVYATDDTGLEIEGELADLQEAVADLLVRLES